jgi:hypothetical protein
MTHFATLEVDRREAIAALGDNPIISLPPLAA